tara:strand:- start:12418 stop:14328 length:1911 start_codon:yes stop_codon:yes gene_type:complete
MRTSSLSRKLCVGLLIVLSVAVAGGFSSYRSASNVKKEWSEYTDSILKRQALLSSIKSNFGYGGAIHNFKNYVLRHTLEYRLKTIANLDSISSALDEYDRLQGETKKERLAILAIRTTVEEYRAAVEAVQTNIGSANTKQLDHLVRIDDAAAIDAFAILSAHHDALTDARRAALTRQIDEMLWLLLVLGAVFLSVIASLLALFQRIVIQPIRVVAEAAAQVSLGNLETKIEYRSADEIGVLAEAFRCLLERQKTLASAAASIGRGDLTVDVKVRSHIDALGNSMVMMKSNIKNLVGDVDHLVKSALAGDLGVRAPDARHKGQFAQIVRGINETLDATVAPMQDANSCLERLGNCDLRARMTSDYQGDHGRMKNAVNKTASVLLNALTEVSKATEQVHLASVKIASASCAVADGARGQASSIEEMAANLEQVASMTKRTADNTRKATEFANSTSSAARLGNEKMSILSTTVQQIQGSASSTAQIIGDINEIAVKTNLLALNASVEASRAGDAGRGFAVVAKEVRNLAQMSQAAAMKTEYLVRESVLLASECATITNDVGNSLRSMVESASLVASLVSEIYLASEEQAVSIDQASRAVSEIDLVVHQTAANSDQTSQAAELLSRQSQTLAALVGRFKI